MSRNDQHIMGQPSFPAHSTTTAPIDEEPFFVEIDESPASSPPPPPTVPAEETGRPAWFRGPTNERQAPPAPPAPPRERQREVPAPQQQKSLRKRAPIIPDAKDEPEELTWQEQLKRWVTGEGGAGYAISVVVHIVVLLAMSLWIISRPSEEDLITTVEQTEVADVAAVRDVNLDVDLKPDIPEQVAQPEMPPAPISMPNLGIGSLANSLSNTTGGGLDFKIPSQAVTKGSFTVWTVPEDPKPGEQYVIMIRIKLNNNVKRYPRRDLSGNVVGTDGYKDYFGGPTESGFLPIKENTVTVEACRVPGAAQLVKDVINVESKILNEKQRIELVF